VARVWNYLVGGRDNFEVDRKAAAQLVAAAPVMEQVAPASRAFLRRAVTYLAAEAGIRQFLDIGTGMPTAGNTHEVAQAVAPASRIVYVDNDPVVLAHARARLRSAAEGATDYLAADARDTRAVIGGARETLDLDEPVGVIMIDVLNFLPDAGEVIARLVAAVPAGSYLVIMQPSADMRLTEAARRWNYLAPTPVILRDLAEVSGWLGGLALVEPGIVEVHQWRPEPGEPSYRDGMPLLGAVAVKP
jgi:SAM-dependent methyltransferase